MGNPEAANPKPGRFGFVHILASIQRLGGEGSLPEQMDRRVVLERLCQAFEVEEAVLLERGFDRAYRQIVEGL